MLGRNRLRRDRIQINNVLLCRPPGSGGLLEYLQSLARANAARKREAKTKGETPDLLLDPVTCCRPRLLKQLRGVRFVFAMGGTALWSLVGKRSVATWHGSPLVTRLPEVEDGCGYHDVPPPGDMLPADPDGATRRPPDGTWVMPLFHPAFVMRKEGKAFARVLRDQFSKGARIYRNDATLWAELGVIPLPSRDEALRALGILKQAKTIAVDIETDGADVMRCMLTAIGLGREGCVLCVPYVRVDGTRYWTEEDEAVVDAAVREVLGDPRIVKVFHNMAFDVFVLRRLGYAVRGPLEDTMLCHHAVLSELPHSLNFVGVQYTDVGFYKHEVKEGGIFKPPDDYTFGRYNCRDVLLTARLWPLVKRACSTQLRVYEQEKALVGYGMEMTARGMRVDMERATRVKQEFAEHVEVCLSKLRELLADTDYRDRMLRAAEKARSEGRPYEHLLHYADSFNPASGVNCMQHAIRALDLPITGRMVGPKNARTKTGLIATGKDTLHRVMPYCDETGREFIRWIVGAADIKSVEGTAQLGYRQVTKLKSTYLDRLDEFVGSDGRVHPTWKVHGTVSGRFACARPNVMNWPAIMKPIIVPEDGYVFVQADMSQLEWRISAVLSQDEALLSVFEREDPHRASAALIFDVGYDEVTSAMRRVWKTVLYAFSYGAEVSTIWQQLLMHDSKMTLREVQEFLKAMERRYPKWMAWRNRLPLQARRQGFLASPILGRRRYFIGGDAGSQALNWPNQSGAADILNDVVLMLMPLLKDRFPDVYLVNQCHDELTLETPEDRAREVGELLGEVMTRPRSLEGKPPYRFPAEVKICRRWGTEVVESWKVPQKGR
jgi:DNA polymerase I-like protein with 3'-5' exonuclease and polymerase domains/uracil-DNA glycosylase